jgi:predicted nucleic acid-binding Zn ribbon protein
MTSLYTGTNVTPGDHPPHANGCAACGSPLPDGRADRRYCSARCQVAAYRAGRRVHKGAKPYRGGRMHDLEPNPAPTPAERASEAVPDVPRESPPRHRPTVPEYVARTVPVYAAGSVHGPTYDARGHRIAEPAPEVVGYLAPDGKLERLEGRRRSAA